jgi:hypothetical protein
MNHTLKLEIPENVYDSLVKVAARISRTPEELAVDWLSAAVQQYAHDPLEKFIGAYSSNIPDWTDQHDKYLGKA